MAQPEKPVIDASRGINFLTSIWIVPVVAFFISLWLVYQHFAKLGTEVRIEFANSGGLEIGQSVIKFRNVPVGKVTRILVRGDGQGVTVVARIDNEVSHYLNNSTRFWIVKPEVDYSGVRGLDTLISGAYIAMHADNNGASKTQFQGLSAPYHDMNLGQYYLLTSDFSSGIHVGTPVNYRDIAVGKIEYMVLDPTTKKVNIVLFVQKEYVHLINATSTFWVQSLVSADIKGRSISLDVAPLAHLISGGIVFDSKFDQNYSPPRPERFFTLYKNRADAQQKKIGSGAGEYRQFHFYFTGALAELNKGASIRYQGFDVGEVTDINLRYDSDKRTMQGEVIGRIDTSIFMDGNRSGLSNLKTAVSEGMRARLATSNPLLGALHIDLVFVSDIAKVTLTEDAKDAIIFPTEPNGGTDMFADIASFIAKLNALPLKETIASFGKLADENAKPLRDTLVALEATIQSIKKMVADDGDLQKLPGEIGDAIKELNRTLRTTKRMLRGYKSDSLFGRRVTEMLKEINKSSEETKRLLKKLNKKPNALIFGE